MHYEDKKAFSQDLNFSTLEARLKKEIGLETISLDILRTLNLSSKEGLYNIGPHRNKPPSRSA